MRAVGRDEVDQRLGVLQVLPEVAPALIGSELAVVRLGEDLPALLVQRRNAHVAGTRDVEDRQVERQTQQVVAQGLRHELVQLVSGLVDRAHDDRPSRPVGRQRPGRPAVEELGRVQERCQEWQRVVALRTGHRVDVRAGDRVVEHRVPEAIGRRRELGRDGRVDVR